MFLFLQNESFSHSEFYKFAQSSGTFFQGMYLQNIQDI